MNGHPRDQAKVSVHCRWPLIRGNLTLKCVGQGFDNVAVQGRWPLTTTAIHIAMQFAKKSPHCVIKIDSQQQRTKIGALLHVARQSD